MAKKTELLPCPFCGSDEVGVGEMPFNSRAKCVGCKCGSNGPVMSRTADAIAGWNKRAKP